LQPFQVIDHQSSVTSDELVTSSLVA
jgi:hypothetical protein